MARQIVNLGTADKGDGDPLRSAFNKINNNFQELYDALGLNEGALNIGAFEFSNNNITTTDSTPINLNQQTNISSDLTVSGNILPNIDGGNDLGSPTKQWRSLYILDSTIYFNGTPLTVDSSGNLRINDQIVATPGGGVDWSSISNKPSFATVSTSGSYNDLSDTPTIPADISDLSDSQNLLADITVGNIQFNDNTIFTDTGMLEIDSISVVPGQGNLSLTASNSISAVSNGLFRISSETGDIELTVNYNQINEKTWSLNTMGDLYADGNLHFDGHGIFISNAGDPKGVITADIEGMTIDTVSLLKIDVGTGLSTKIWQFNLDGDIVLPENGDVLDSEGNSVLLSSPLATVATSGSYNDLTDKPDLTSSGDVKGSVFADDSTLLVDGVSGKLVGPVQTSSVTPTTNSLILGTANENLTIDSGVVMLKNTQTKTETYSSSNGDWDSATWFQDPTIGFLEGLVEFDSPSIYIQTLLKRLMGYYDGISDPWITAITNVSLIINGSIPLTILSVNGVQPWHFRVEQYPPENIVTVTSFSITYTYESQLGLDSTNDYYHVILDNQNFRINTRRDIRLESGDDIYIDGNSSMRLRNNSTTNGIRIQTDYSNIGHEWTFDPSGALTIPGDIRSESAINIDINLSDSTLRRWTFGEDGDLKFPDATAQSTAFTGNAATVDILATNGLTSTMYPAFVDATTGTATVRADQDLTYRTDDNLLTVGNITTGILKINDGVHEKYQTKTDATGTVTHDCSLGHIFYHTSPDDFFTVNLTNLNLSSGYATTVTVVMVQGSTGYGPNALQIDGVAQTINWQGGSLPSGTTANGVDVATFSIINNGGTYTVLAQVTGFNNVE